MKSGILLAVLTLSSLVLVNRSQGRHHDDHLIPFEQSVIDDRFRPWLYKKLLLTTADCGRMVEFATQPNQLEYSVSVHCEKEAAPDAQCYVTVVRAKAKLGKVLDDNLFEGSLAAIDKIAVLRKDAPIERNIALTLRKVWIKILRKTRPVKPSERVVNDGEKIEFWIDMPGGTKLSGEIPDSPGNHLCAFVELGRLVARYCEAPKHSRLGIAQRIRRDADRLAGVRMP